jgi:hypothetical protein
MFKPQVNGSLFQYKIKMWMIFCTEVFCTNVEQEEKSISVPWTKENNLQNIPTLKQKQQIWDCYTSAEMGGER